MFNSYFEQNLHEIPTTLCEIMNKQGSDKGSGWHNYTTFYHHIFKDICNDVTNVFELGLGTNNPNIPSSMGVYGVPCASVRGWRDYFKNARIYGADVDRGILVNESNLETFYCDQTDVVSIKELWENLPQKFDIIIEDGLHMYEANITFFENSHHKLVDGGIYIIEDILYKDFERFEKYIEENQFKFKEMSLVKIPNKKNDVDNNLIFIRK